MMSDEYYMGEALKEAKKAYLKDEVPVGCIIICDDKIIARAHNLRETKKSALAHAEVVAIHKACQKLEQKFLDNCVLYVTLEPCLMCLGAILQARIKKVVYGAEEPKFGCLKSLGNPLEDYKFNHKIEIKAKVLETEASQMMKTFFQMKRHKD